MYSRFVPGCLAILLAYSAASSSAPIAVPGVFSTGVDDSGNLLAEGSPETHYVLTTGNAAALAILPNPSWVSAPPGSAWIGPTGGNVSDAPGEYSYAMTIDLSGFLPETAVLSGELAADNSVSIFLNGADTGVRIPGFGSTTSFTIATGFVPGLNSFEFRVTNGPAAFPSNPTGLLISNLSVTAEPAVSEVLVTASELTVAEPDGSDQFEIRLNRAPSASVLVSLSALSNARRCRVSPDEVVLDASTWETGVAVTVTANDNDRADGDRLCRIRIAEVQSADTGFDGVEAADVLVTVEDDDDRGSSAVPALSTVGLGLLTLVLLALGLAAAGRR
jgi:hypothetical protein